jgi:hypothetical protein
MSMLPVRRSPVPHDADVVAGHGASSRDLAGATTRSGRADADLGVEPTSAQSPAVEAEGRDWAGSRVAASTLRQVRDDADRLATELEQVVGARGAVGHVRQLVEQLRDVAVVSLDRSLEPANRAALQRQVDRTLADIDDLASGALPDTLATPALAAVTTPGTLPSIGTATLGIASLGVRSSDDAFGTMHALDRALGRLTSTALSLDGAVARFRRDLDLLTSPGQTASGEPALTGATAALTSTVLTADRLQAQPDEATVAQGSPLASRVRSLLD